MNSPTVSSLYLRQLGEIEIGLGTLVATNERITEAIEPSIMTIVFITAIKLLPNKNVWLIYVVTLKN